MVQVTYPGLLACVLMCLDKKMPPLLLLFSHTKRKSQRGVCVCVCVGDVISA